MDDPNQIISPDNTPKDDPQIDTREYQNILNKYAQEISKNPPEIQTPPPAETELPSQEIQLSELPPAPPVQPPPAPEYELPQTPLEPPPALPPKDGLEPPEDEEEVLPSKPNPFVKILFFFSLLIFLAVSIGLIYVYFVLPVQTDEQSSVPLTQNTPTSIPSGVCLLNDQSYNVGQSFPAADGCNTCTCQEDLTIYCNEIACEPTKSATTSAIPKDWKTYTNSTYSFSFQYPSISTVNNNNYTGYLATFIINKISTVDPNTDITFYIGSNDENKTYTGTESIKVAGLNATRVSLPIGQNPAQELVFFNKDGKYYHFQFVWDGKTNKDLEIFNQILSTFKFISPAESASSEQQILVKMLQNSIYPTAPEKVKIESTIQNNFASGTYQIILDPDGGPGGGWIAAKNSSGWFLVEAFQEPPSCQLMKKYNVPVSIYGTCIDK